MKQIKVAPAVQGRAREKIKLTRHKYTNLDIASQVLSLFRGRDDHIVLFEGRSIRHETQNSPLTAEDFVKFHLIGHTCLAFYLLLPDGTVWCSCIDIDNKPNRPDPEWRAKAAKVYQSLLASGLDALVEISQSGRAVHVWIFFDKPVAAWLVRAFWLGIINYLNLPVPEVFPRQDSLEGKTVGNAIRYPLYNQSRFVDVENGWETIEPYKALTNVKKITAEMLNKAADRLGFELERQQNRCPVSGEYRDALPLRVQQLLAIDPNSYLARRWRGDAEGLPDKSRSGLVYSIASNLIRAYIPTDEIKAAIRVWCEDHGYEKGQRDEWIDRTVEKAYNRLFESQLTYKKRPAIFNKMCSGTGPIAREYRKKLKR